MLCDTFPAVVDSSETGTGTGTEEEGGGIAAAATAADDEGTGKVVAASTSAFSTVPLLGSWTSVPTGIDVEVSPVTPKGPKGTVPAHTSSISFERSFTWTNTEFDIAL